MTAVSSFLALMASFMPLMTAPSFQNFVLLASGWIMTPGRRTVTQLLQGAGAVGKKDHSAFHRFFSRARWSMDQVSRVVLTMILKLLPDGVVYLAVDDTLCRKRGLHIFGTCMHHDPLISCRRVPLVNWGHNWVVLGVVVELPFSPGVVWCLPFAFRLYISKKRPRSQRWKLQNYTHRTRPELAAEMLKQVGEWFPHRVFHVLGDSAYGGGSVLNEIPKNMLLTSRIVLDACLYDDPPPRSGRGRPRTKGKRLPTPAQHAASARQKWRTLKVLMYGKKQSVEIKEITGRWKAAGCRRVRVTIVRTPSGCRKLQAFYTIDLEASPEDTLTRYAKRWSIEVTFQNTKGHLGFEDPQNRTRPAVERTAPVAMVMYTLVVLWFAEVGHRRCTFPNRPWYQSKSTPSFADMLTTLRSESIREHFQRYPQLRQGSRKILRILDDALRLAA